MKHIVTSCDSIQFVTESDPRSVKTDQLFASVRTSEELERHGDFHRVRSIEDVFWDDSPVPTPAARRASFRLIQGGKS